VVQVNGKLRDRFAVPVSITGDEARKLALDRQRVKSYIEGKQITQIVYVPKRLINLVVK
jgi:leucyl-tRNA synthetase